MSLPTEPRMSHCCGYAMIAKAWESRIGSVGVTRGQE